MKTNCPYCNYLATEHETLDNQKNPKEGDISFCIECGEVSQYSKNCLIKVEVDSLDESTKKEIADIQTAWLRTKSIHNLKQREVRE
ncbi:hypothetical protein LCGC14_0571000 [marine sediment metagenome]|uniref:Uncharacterized protein n=1 Tax=marine sediment metagenome TaxID=412755 RepID=A0A0F9S2Q7_9ZZZZ